MRFILNTSKGGISMMMKRLPEYCRQFDPQEFNGNGLVITQPYTLPMAHIVKNYAILESIDIDHMDMSQMAEVARKEFGYTHHKTVYFDIYNYCDQQYILTEEELLPVDMR